MNKVTVAFVDDHKLMRHALCEVINTFEDYVVLFEADNGQDFIKKLTHVGLPQMVIMDIDMPLMNGYAATRWLQQQYPHTKVIALSMIDTEYAITCMVINGACAFIPKDADPDEFKTTLNHVYQSGFYFGGECGGFVRKTMQFSKYKQPTLPTQLSQIDIHFLKLCCLAVSYKEIALELKITVKQVEYLQTQLYQQFDLNSRTQLALFAVQNALIDFTPPR